MFEKQNEIEVYQSARFEKVLKKMPENDLKVVEDEIDRIIDNPLIGELKKGDLDYLRVHKFRLNELVVLLGYSWVSSRLALYLLSIGSHENYDEKQKKQTKSDLKLIK